MFKKILNKLSNTLLFYVDKSGKSVFRNYFLIKPDGYQYEETYTIQTAGKALEYRMELDKKLNLATLIISIVVYLIFINMKFNFLSFLFVAILWLALVFGARYGCNKLYSKFLLRTFGRYRVVNFSPALSKEKIRKFKSNFRAKVALILIILVLFFVPAFLMQKLIKLSVNAKKPHYKIAIGISKLYKAIYPKTTKIYDMSAYAKYLAEDYEGALKDYEKIFEITGKNFSQKDLNRFANMLYLEKKLYGSQNAIDKFNEYSTIKKMSVLEQSQMLWLKSIFSLKNNNYELVLQDYDDLLASLKEDDVKNKFYISSDKAYMMFLMRDYKNALALYDYLISAAVQDDKVFGKELPRLYAERGFTKRALGDNIGADEDFIDSGIDMYQLEEFKPTISDSHGFIADKF